MVPVKLKLKSRHNGPFKNIRIPPISKKNRAQYNLPTGAVNMTINTGKTFDNINTVNDLLNTASH